MSGELVAFYQGATELRPVAFSAATASSLSQALIRPERRISPVRSGADPTVVLANPDLIGKLGVAVPRRFPAGHLLSALSAAVFASFRSRAALQVEILALHHQLSVQQRSVKRARLTPADRLLWAWLCAVWSDWQSSLFIVKVSP